MAQDLNDEALLRDWSFYTDYKRNKQALIGVLEIVYVVAQSTLGDDIGASDCEGILDLALQSNYVFQAMVRGKNHLPDPLVPLARSAMARFLLRKHWEQVQNGGR